MNDLPIRKPTRLCDFDYSTPGAYFVTICVQNRLNYFDDENVKGILRDVLESLPEHHNVALDEFVIMPDHVHFVIWICHGKMKSDVINETGDARDAPTDADLINDADRRVEACLDRQKVHLDRTNKKRKSGTLGAIVGSFKSAVSKCIRAELGKHFAWQRGFYDHIVRNEDELNIIRQYIQFNPEKLDWGD